MNVVGILATNVIMKQLQRTCLLYTSDAADEEDSVDLGGRRIIKKNNKKGEVKLKVENISLRTDIGGFNNLNDINLSIKAGEVLGVAGVSGNGQVELANIISGINSNFQGKVTIKGEDVSEKGVKARKQLNLSYIPENRLGVGLAPGVSIFCLLYTSPSPRDKRQSRMPSSA